VVAALDLVVRITPAAVVASPQPGQDPQAIVSHPFEQAMRGDLVLHPGPDLIGIANRHGRAATMRPGADQQARVVGVGEHPVTMLEAAETVAVIEGDDRCQSRTHVVRRQDVAQVQLVCPPLAQQLVGQASVAEIKRLTAGLLAVVLAVP
jgi:hypothetical protein